ncbi:glycerophosphodiester phosphodiesterase family protein [Lysobacter korlensis]|uniref:Glycerophosphodiester phosphodiesterase family protein n=1 Tax=Lysobacter korlensis TaxID=553636 RepID=A0ABV6RXY8_9GAMM
MSDAPLPYFSPPTPRVFAHRGLASGVPENTLAAFSHALNAGAGYLESDVRATRDGVAVLAHDADLRRLTGRTDRISDLTAAELADTDLGGHRVPTLHEALAAFPAARFNLDLKAADAVDAAIAAIREADAVDRVLVSSFDEQRRAGAVRALPGIATSASSRIATRALAALRAGLPRTAARVLNGVHAVQVPETARGVRVVSPRTVAGFHSAGVEVHVWTVNAASAMRRLLEWGVDGIVTDRADVAVSVVRGTNLSH